MSTAKVTPITKNLNIEEAIERGYHLLTASLDLPEFHQFAANQIGANDDGPEAA